MKSSFEKYTSYSDSQLINSLLANDKDAIVYFFYKKYMPVFQYHLFKLYTDKVRIEDLVDEFFLYLQENNWHRLRTFNGSVSLNTWISVVSYRFFKNYKRSKIDSNGVVTTNETWEQFTGDWVQTVDAGISIDVENAIEEIKNERDREIVRRLLLEDQEPQKVADALQVTVDYLYTIKNRAVKQLRESLKTYRTNAGR